MNNDEVQKRKREMESPIQLKRRPKHREPVSPEDFEMGPEYLLELIKKRIHYHRELFSLDDRSAIGSIESSLEIKNNMLVGSSRASRSTMARINQVLEYVGPFIYSKEDTQWRMKVTLLDESTKPQSHQTYAMKLFWERLSGKKKTNSQTRSQDCDLSNTSPRALTLPEARNWICNRDVYIDNLDEKERNAYADSAIRARLLRFDAKSDPSGPQAQLKQLRSSFESDACQDLAITSLHRRMATWDYCIKIIINELTAETIAYASAAPVHDNMTWSLDDFKKHGDNLTSMHILWKKPDPEVTITLCFSGFRILSGLLDSDQTTAMLMKSVFDICKKFDDDGWCVGHVMLNLHQQAACELIHGLGLNCDYEPNGIFAKISYAELRSHFGPPDTESPPAAGA